MRKSLFGCGSIHPSLKTIAASAACVAAISFLGSAAQAQAVSAATTVLRPVAEGARTSPTAGWQRFCQQAPSECVVNLAEPATIKLTGSIWQTIVRINQDVNASIRPMTDLQHWGVEDRWDFAEDGYGDCEDYQLVKRRLLVKTGLPRRALRMTVVIDELGGGMQS